ncbi:hypothetical protein ATK17_0425 [Branchiibius hedensis]|uniref:Leucine-rich repeat domain-containing protein n=1 Tax=Branchiibius hedensis TaxID=672460 RepID=A0A2Y8ZMY3_9MICO|nr:hypothetical protein [Branchiibius hedensis]PWJ24337.1 hypothetical protein ATK17_0425 [Branchiibius hedensis]SSA33154.1 hypothetical protein SAMN04489750_0425 [Branchiibius hedensis]
MKRDKVPILIEASEYEGQPAIVVACSQLGSRYTPARAKKIVEEWIELLGGPMPLVDLEFTTRTPKRVFAALSGQPQLTRLAVKWGDYADLRPIAAMTQLRSLELRGASAVTDLRPLMGLDRLEVLAVEGFRSIAEPSPLVSLHGLRELELGGDWMTPRNGHIATIGFMRELRHLEELLLHTLIVDDLDYGPLLELPSLRAVRVMKVRGMRPNHDELRRRLPWKA